ncbi:hypothetical protein [Rhizobium sp. 12,4]|uniref:hypothetical protein n=1 Tax=Rhizobium sp. 12,4 TaxID=3405135 RepID=UPI003D3505C2
MTRIDIRTYDPTTPEAVQALLSYLKAATKTLNGKEVIGETDQPTPNPEVLLQGLPQRSLSAARYDRESGLIAFTIKDRNERFIEPEGFAIVRILTLFGPGLHIDKDQTGGNEHHYLEVFSDEGITLQRLLADAKEGEMVKFIGDHHLLTAANFTILRNHKAKRGRNEAVLAALAAYDKHATEWGYEAVLNRADYEAMIRHAFRLYDLKYGREHLRVAAE